MRVYLLLASFIPSAVFAVAGAIWVMRWLERLLTVPSGVFGPAFVILFAFLFATISSLCFRALGMQLKRINGRYYVLDHWAKDPSE